MRLISAAPRGVAANRRSRTIRRGSLLEDRLERLNRLGIGERQKLALVGQTLTERRHQVEGRDDHEGEDTISVYHAATRRCFYNGHVQHRHTVNAVLFDLDDTLFDHEQAARAALAVCTGRTARSHFGPSMRSSRRTRGHSRSSTSTCSTGARSIDDAREERFRRLFVASRRARGCRRVRRTAAAYREAYLAARRPVEGALAVLAALKPRVRIGIVSNNLLDEQQDKITLCGFDGYVDALVVSEEVGVAKPDPAIFRASARGSGVSGVRRGDGRRLVGRRHRGRARCGDSADLVQPLRGRPAPDGSRDVRVDLDAVAD